ncbi:MAG TPA: 30S ribosomal protein S12 methylthiotransferase RimO [Clostridiales bacterium]|nr:30S ribosomal protein S12 methylthiotransferase RimO [Clostridiales bacterium]
MKTLGCDKNTVDSQSAAGLLRAEGHQVTEDASLADVIMVNTCGFIQDAKQESIDAIMDLAAEKKAHQLLIVSGCLSQRYGDKLAKLIPEVDFFLGVNDYSRLPDILKGKSEGQRVYQNSCGAMYEEIGRRETTRAIYTAPIKIAEGCNNICSYCSIPSIRGFYRSRKASDIISEAESLAKIGCKELVVVAQDVTAYGCDLPGEGHLVRLLEDLCAVDGIHWIRLMYCYEDRITDALIDTIRNQPKICKYLDIPLQHCSDTVLQKMNRHSTKASIMGTVTRLRKHIPEIALRTTLIAGFPGETNDDFNELLEFVKEMKFERLGVFAYSKEEGTAAACLPNQIRKNVKERRRDRIMAIQRVISLESNRQLIGKTLEVLVEETYEDGSYGGRTYRDAPEIDDSILFTSEVPLFAGDFVPVLITDAFDYDLTGIAKPEVKHESAQ